MGFVSFNSFYHTKKDLEVFLMHHILNSKVKDLKKMT